MSFLSEHRRTHGCGELRGADAGKEVVVYGWVDTRRDHGGCVFVDLRDRTGVCQVVFRPETGAAAHEAAGRLRSEYCIGAAGRVVSRGDNANPKLPTGEVEIEARALEIFSASEPPPFPVGGDTEAGEAVRLRHRYLDLRRPALARNFQVRSRAARAVREHMASCGFTEVETPFMVKYTPGGARNFLVPSRLNPGQFYALAESPQIFKQLLMVAGFERYYQIVRCFRDEDLRNDRQPEFTQIDVEMSFVREDDVFEVIEGLMVRIWKDVLGIDVPRPVRRMPYGEALARFGSDKPDLRFGLELCDVTDAARACGFRVFEQAVAEGGTVRGLRLARGHELSRSELDRLADVVKPHGAKGLAWARVQEGGAWQAPFSKAIPDDARARFNERMSAGPGDVLCFVADRGEVPMWSLGALRLAMAKRFGLVPEGRWEFSWVTDFPLFERTDAGWAARHHPFTSPREQDVDRLETDPGACHARAYDLVINGNEIGGGSIRIHRADVQERVFRALGISEEQRQEKFGFLLEAFRYGPPPHGGIALGLDRLAALLCGAESLRDVIAFPKTQKGACLMTGAPGGVSDRQLQELHIRPRAVPSS